MAGELKGPCSCRGQKLEANSQMSRGDCTLQLGGRGRPWLEDGSVGRANRPRAGTRQRDTGNGRGTAGRRGAIAALYCETTVDDYMVEGRSLGSAVMLPARGTFLAGRATRTCLSATHPESAHCSHAAERMCQHSHRRGG